MELLYEGKAKKIFATPIPREVRLHFKDEATAFDGTKKSVFADKGRVNCYISSHLLHQLNQNGVPTHFIRQLTTNEQLCHNVDIIPIEVVVRNVTAGSICRRFGVAEGEKLNKPMVEFFYKSDELHDPPMSRTHALEFGWAEGWEMSYMKYAALAVNEFLCEFWDKLGITLVDFKLEFGRTPGGQLLLADEITPDGCRLWEKGTRRSLDKDVFRKDSADLSATYRELLQRVMAGDSGTDPDYLWRIWGDQ